MLLLSDGLSGRGGSAEEKEAGWVHIWDCRRREEEGGFG